MHVAMAMTPPLSLSGKTPRLSITRPANSAILIKIKAIVSPPFHASLAPFFAPRLGVPLTESRNYGTDFLKPGCGFSSLSCEWPPLEEGPYPADVEIRCHLSRVWCWLPPH